MTNFYAKTMLKYTHIFIYRHQIMVYIFKWQQINTSNDCICSSWKKLVANIDMDDKLSLLMSHNYFKKSKIG